MKLFEEAEQKVLIQCEFLQLGLSENYRFVFQKLCLHPTSTCYFCHST